MYQATHKYIKENKSLNFKTMNKIIKTAVVNKLENVKYTRQINYTFLKKKTEMAKLTERKREDLSFYN